MAIYRGTGLQGEGEVSDFSQLVQDAQAAADAAEQAYADTIAVYGSITAVNNAVTAAQLAEINAETAEVNAETAETNAETAATNATNSATSAATSATNAANSATSAANSATTATTQATNAANSASAASTSASNAATSATNAANSATSAANSANSAASSATSAANSATTATASANTAISKANEATASATSAATSAASASSSATLAATSATDAAGYVNDALDLYNGSAALDAAVDAAQASATASATSATASANSATQATTNGAIQVALATTQATNATTSATAAATSATNAANSATQAANSAASAAAIVTGVASNRPSIRPSLLLDFANTKQLDPRVTFSRASTGAYYDGKTVVKAEENLLIQSQNFTTSWNNIGFSVASGATAPDSTATAFTANEGTAASAVHSTHLAPSITASSIMTLSVFAKNVDARYIGVTINTAQNNYGTVEFDLDGSGAVNRTAVLGTDFSIISTSITAVGSGWFRCVAVISVGSASVSDGRATIYMSDGTGAFDNRGRVIYTGTNRTLQIWGAQLEQRSTVTAYTPTTTAPITNYIPALQTAASNVARFDHDPVTGESKGLLIEEQRTNLLTYSEQFDNAAWTKLNSSITSNTIVAPDGLLSGDLIVANTTNAQHRLDLTPSSSAGSQVLSVYAKSGGYNFIGLRIGSSGTSFNLSTGAVSVNGSGSVGSIQSVGNGWYRCSIVVAAASANDIARINITDAVSPSTAFAGDGYSGIYIWGAQLEAGSFPTSYIQTVASQVTRSADSASMTGSNFSSWYRADEGTLYAEALSPAATGFYFASTISDGTSGNEIRLGSQSGGGNYQLVVSVAGSAQASLTGQAVSAGTLYKVAGGYKANDFVSSVNNSAVATDTSGSIPVVNQLSIGSRGDNTYRINGTIKRFVFWPKRLSNTEIQGVTTS